MKKETLSIIATTVFMCSAIVGTGIYINSDKPNPSPINSEVASTDYEVISTENQTEVISTEVTPIVEEESVTPEELALYYTEENAKYARTLSGEIKEYYAEACRKLTNATWGLLLDKPIVYDSTDDGGGHFYCYAGSDIIAAVDYDEYGNPVPYESAGNRYGSDYSMVYLEKEPENRSDLYQWLMYNSRTSGNVYIYTSNGTLEDLETGATYYYDDYIGTDTVICDEYPDSIPSEFTDHWDTIRDTFQPYPYPRNLEYLGDGTFGIKNTDVTCCFYFADDGTLLQSECGNKYGSDCATVYFMKEPKDRMVIYDWLYENGEHDYYVYDLNGNLKDYTGNKVYDYKE